jgi:hypothetical protein
VIPVISDFKEKYRVLNCIYFYSIMIFLSGATLRSSTPNPNAYNYYRNQHITIGTFRAS